MKTLHYVPIVRRQSRLSAIGMLPYLISLTGLWAANCHGETVITTPSGKTIVNVLNPADRAYPSRQLVINPKVDTIIGHGMGGGEPYYGTLFTLNADNSIHSTYSLKSLSAQMPPGQLRRDGGRGFGPILLDSCFGAMPYVDPYTQEVECTALDISKATGRPVIGNMGLCYGPAKKSPMGWRMYFPDGRSKPVRDSAIAKLFGFSDYANNGGYTLGGSNGGYRRAKGLSVTVDGKVLFAPFRMPETRWTGRYSKPASRVVASGGGIGFITGMITGDPNLGQLAQTAFDHKTEIGAATAYTRTAIRAYGPNVARATGQLATRTAVAAAPVAGIAVEATGIAAGLVAVGTVCLGSVDGFVREDGTSTMTHVYRGGVGGTIKYLWQDASTNGGRGWFWQK